MNQHLQAVSALLFLAFLPAGAAAQVGHRPESSPYRELVAKQAASVIAGYLTGSRGIANVGPSNGTILGVRYDRSIATPVDIQVGLSAARLDRFRVNPNLPVATRTTGPVKQDLALMEAGLSLVLMGRKTWHGISPYIGAGLGIAFETGLGSDESGYQFGTKVLLAPHAGFKWYPVQALAVKIEGRTYFWRLTYPTSFGLSPGGTITTVLPVGSGFNEWTAHPALLLSLGYTFAPF